MGRKSGAGRYRDIPGARSLPGGPGAEGAPRKGLHIATKITLMLAAITLIALLTLTFGGRGISMYIHWYWVSWLLASLFAGEIAVLILLGLRRIARTNWSKLAFTCVMVVALAAVAGAGLAMTTTFYEYGEVPIAYYDSPQGERVVVMRSGNRDKDMNADGTLPHVYTAYQMLNRWFYLQQTSGDVYANNEDNPVYVLEWLPDGNARLYLPDYEGKAHSEAEVIVYDLDNLEQSLAEKTAAMEEKRANATPAPTDSPEDLAPKPSADPFAYDPDKL